MLPQRSSLLARLSAPLLASALALGGCGDDDEPLPTPDAGGVLGDAAPPVADAAPDAAQIAWVFSDVYGVPNLDDDNGAGVDFLEAPFAGDDDLSTLLLPAAQMDSLGPDEGLELRLADDGGQLKIWRDGELLLGPDMPGPHTLQPSGALELQVEFGDYNASAVLEIARVSATGENLETAAVSLRAAPLIMNHHGQPAERLWALSVNAPGYSNKAFIDGYKNALGDRFVSLPGAPYDWDVWVQDEIEFATLTGAAGERLDVVIDSIRDRGLAPFAESELVGPGTIAATWGVPSQRTTFDAFGNLEASPPVVVDKTAYPFGRIYYGRIGNAGLNSVLGDFLAEQKIQSPFQLPTQWLCVGHVDEFSSIVPDPSSPKGFKLLLSDIPSGVALLQSLSPALSLPQYADDHGYATVGDILDDPGLMSLNVDLQSDYLDPIAETFKAELGLTDDDIIRVPSLFERVPGCGGRVVALIPGMVNLIVANVAGEPARLFVPDPFFRDDVTSQVGDPFIDAFDAAMPAGLELHYLDNWDVYHMGLGEVHCGTNVQRTPVGEWWTEGMALLGGN